MELQKKISTTTLRKKSHVKTSKGRKTSSTAWLHRQINDPYVKKAHEMGYRARAVFKLSEIDDKYHILKKGYKVVDLGNAPGSWTQLLVERCGAGNVVGVDLLKVEPVQGAVCLQGDFTKFDGLEAVENSLLAMNLKGRKVEDLSADELALAKKCDVVVSDMAANTTGFKPADSIRTLALAEMGLDFAIENLKPKGHFICKTFQGGGSTELLGKAKLHFNKVTSYKPPSSRKGSVEMFLIAIDKKK